MNAYYVQYRLGPDWVPFMMLADSINEVWEWARVRFTGSLCVSIHEPWPEESSVDLW